MTSGLDSLSRRGLLPCLLGGLLATALVLGLGPLLERSSLQAPAPLEPMLEALIPLSPPPPEQTHPEPPPPPPMLKPPQPPPPEPVNLEAPPLQPEPLRLPEKARLLQGLPLLPPGPQAFGLGEVDRPPVALGRIPPPYPWMARRRGQEGQVRVRFLVDSQGRVSHPQVVKSQPPGVFDQTVLSTLLRWRFKPAYKDGRAVAVWVVTTINFNLEGP